MDFGHPPLEEVLDRFSGPPVVEGIILATGMHLETIMGGRDHQKILKNAKKCQKNGLCQRVKIPHRRRQAMRHVRHWRIPWHAGPRGLMECRQTGGRILPQTPRVGGRLQGKKCQKNMWHFRTQKKGPDEFQRCQVRKKCPKFFWRLGALIPWWKMGRCRSPRCKVLPKACRHWSGCSRHL